MRKSLPGTAISLARNAKDFAISKEPFSLAVRQGDDQFADIVRWMPFAMIEAEEYRITRGVDEKWVYDIVRQVGNHGESYDRNLVMARPSRSPAATTRCAPAGILYVPPIR